MSLRSRAASLWRNVFRRTAVDAELDEELRGYVDLLADEHLRAGVPAARARRLALRQAEVHRVTDRVRDTRAGARVEAFLRDLRFGARTMARVPGFTAAVVLSLALGVGGTTAIFSVVKAVLLRPLPYPAADRLYTTRVWWGDFSALLSPADLLALRETAGEVAEVGGYFFPDDGFSMRTPDGPAIVRGAVMTEGLLRVLGRAPVLGAGFSAEGFEREALIGEALWRERYGAAPDVLGRSIELDAEPFTIVGVMPAGFNVPEQPHGAVWLQWAPRPPTRRGPFFLRTIVRVHDGIEPETARAQLDGVVSPLLRDRYGVNEEWRYGLEPVRDVIVGDVRPTLALFGAAVGLVWLIAVINVANLLLARGAERLRELAARVALGASRGRLARQLFAESALYGVGGGGLGLALAVIGLQLMRREVARVLPSVDGVPLDPITVAFALAVGVGAGLLAGALPAARLPWSRLGEELREGGRGTAGGQRSGRARRALVIAEVALTLTVLTGATLLVKSLRHLESVDPGFRADGVASFRLVLPDVEYPDSAEDKLAAFLDGLEDRLAAIPGVSGVAYSSALPPDRLQGTNNYTAEGSQPDGRGADGVAEWLIASEEYFRALGIGLRSGRVFTDADRAGGPGVAVVNEAFARRHYPDGAAVGKRFKGGDWNAEAPWLTIVGVVADVPYDRGVWGGVQPTVYTAYAQNLWQSSPFVVVRTEGDAAAIVPDIREVVRAALPHVALRDVATMRERLRGSTAEPRFRGLLFTLLAAVALALAVTGIYGVMAYDVSRRRHETAIRRALGAGTGAVVGGVVASGMRLAAVGLLLGAAGAVALSRALTGLLYQIEPLDAGAYAAAAAALAGAALVACAAPAWRAAQVDPMVALRED